MPSSPPLGSTIEVEAHTRTKLALAQRLPPGIAPGACEEGSFQAARPVGHVFSSLDSGSGSLVDSLQSTEKVRL